MSRRSETNETISELNTSIIGGILPILSQMALSLETIADVAEMKEFPERPERRTGQWKVQTIKGKDLAYCSECGFGKRVDETRRYNYCPNCGARLEGDKERV